MEFGLQKAEKLESPLLAGNPRKRIEAKAYRARDRVDNGWFRHDAATPENSPNVSPASSPLRVAGGQSQQVLGNLCVRCSCAKLHKFQQHNVTAGVQSEHLNRGQSPKKVRSKGATARLQQQVYHSCNDWYRHEHTVIASDTDEEHSPVPTWWPRDQAASGQSSPRSRRVCAEAEVYWKRNHDGSAKDWYRHEHTLIEEKENDSEDVNKLVASPAKEYGSSEANLNIASDGHGCCICGGLKVSPAKVTDKKECQQVLTERF